MQDNIKVEIALFHYTGFTLMHLCDSQTQARHNIIELKRTTCFQQVNHDEVFSDRENLKTATCVCQRRFKLTAQAFHKCFYTLQHNLTFNNPTKKKWLGKRLWEKGQNAGNKCFLLFPHFSIL